jgi:hypothetical protein
LQDQENIDVRTLVVMLFPYPDNVQVHHAALLASVAFLAAADATQLARFISLMLPTLKILPGLANSLSQPLLGSSSSSTLKT